MWVEVSIFSVSLVICGIIIYILGLLWFGDTRNRQSKSFFILGVFVTLWTLLNAIAIISAGRFFPFVYTLRITLVAIVPFSVFWFILNFAHVKWLRYRFAPFIIWLLGSIDALAMLTNPLHHFMFLDYAFPVPARNLGFWIHTGTDAFIIIISFIVLLRYVFKHARNEPLVIIAGFGTFIPYILNVLYTFGFSLIPYDITPLGFFITFMLFTISSYRSQLLNIKTLTLNNIYALLKDIILVINEYAQIIDANPAAVRTYSDFPFASGQSYLGDFFVYLEKQGAKCIPLNLFDPVLSGVVERGGEIMLYHEDGRKITYTVALKTTMVKNRPTGYILIMTDVSVYRSMISEINEQNAKLDDLRVAAEAASMAKSAFLANMSHEIRTPLNAVIGMAYIANKSAENEKTIAAIKEIEVASMHLLGVLNNVLDMSKIESGKFELVYEPFLLRTAMDEVAILIDQRCREKNIHLEAGFGDIKNYRLLGDKLRLRQILVNLLGNAVKFTPEDGIVSFALGMEEENDRAVKVHFMVRDNGIGMSEEQISRLFQTFSQADSTIFNRFGGSGLGLSISQSLAVMMGGKIGVKSRQGEGTVFDFSLVFAKAGDYSDDEEKPGDIVPDLSGKRILLVEDVEINRIILAELLSDTMVVIEEAVDGAAAVNAFEEKPLNYYDLVFMDIQMPILDGYETTRRIRSLDRPDAVTVPIIAMTANAYREDIEKALASGMNGHLSKPIDIKAVMQMLSEKLGK